MNCESYECCINCIGILNDCKNCWFIEGNKDEDKKWICK